MMKINLFMAPAIVLDGITLLVLAEGEKRRRRMNIITLASSTERRPTSLFCFDDNRQGSEETL
jgi:hypothetical protein